MNSKEQLIEHLKEETRVFKDERVEEAFKKIDRADFVGDDYKVEAYEDYPLPIGHSQTISQPTTVAFMLEKLDVHEGDKVLDVGAGSGWATALLSVMVGPGGEVFGVERIDELVEFGKGNLEKYNFKNASIQKAGDKFGLSKEAPFDKILVSAAAKEVPEELLLQLKPGGTMVIPIQNSIFIYKKKKTGEISKKEFPGFIFVPLVG